MVTIDTLEYNRVTLQKHLDSMKTSIERNKMGQFATPTMLAQDILEYAMRLLPENININFFDPAIGTGSFYSALLKVFPTSRIKNAMGFEIDPHYGKITRGIWMNTPLKVKIADFTRNVPPCKEDVKANLIICNPPYVRHHHLTSEEKERLQKLTECITGIKLSGLTGLYCYFLCLSYSWMEDGGLAGWLIPSEFMDVNYGQEVKSYLLNNVRLLRIHRFEPRDVQFEDALVSSAIVWLKKEVPPENYDIEFSYGGTLSSPRIVRRISKDILQDTAKWTKYPARAEEKRGGHKGPRLSDFFKIKRGIATGNNKFFILTEEQIRAHRIPSEFLIPILPSPRYLLNDEVNADEKGNPILSNRQYLLSCKLKEGEVKEKYPALWEYLELGIKNKINEGYLCRHRNPWYSQENRPPTPFLCTYMGRGRKEHGGPFRFILNYSKATAPNVYLMLYPESFLRRRIHAIPEIMKAIWQELNKISPEKIMDEGRVYGGGLYKIEPNELGNACAENILSILPGIRIERGEQLMLF